MSSSRASFKQVPLDNLVPELVRRLSLMPIDDLVAVLPCLDRAAEASASPESVAQAVLALPGRSKLRDAERAVIAHALAVSDGNVSAAARLIGVDRKALERKIRRHGLSGARKR